MNVSTSYDGNYIIPKAHDCRFPLYDSKGRYQGTVSSRYFDKTATIEAISKRIAKLEAQQLLEATDADDEAELARLRADLERFSS